MPSETASDITYRGARSNVLARIGLPLVLFAYWAWSGIPQGGWPAIGGWFCAVTFGAGALFCIVYVVNPPRLTLTEQGFAWTSALARNGVRAKWSEIADVGLYTHQTVSLRGDEPPATRGIGFTLKSSALSGDRERKALTCLGLTGWHGVVTDNWGVSNAELLREFRRRLAISRGPSR